MIRWQQDLYLLSTFLLVEVTTIHPDTWSSALDRNNQSFHYIPVWKENYEALISGQVQQRDEFESILNRVKSELSSSSGIVVVCSITPLLFRHSFTRVARFLGKYFIIQIYTSLLEKVIRPSKNV